MNSSLIALSDSVRYIRAGGVRTGADDAWRGGKSSARLLADREEMDVGVIAAARNLFGEIRTFFVHWQDAAVASLVYRRSGDLRIHAGCGPQLKQGWINIDLKKGADIRLDLRRRLPFTSGSASEIYFEHFLEHLDYPEPAAAFLRECHRILAPGGKVSIAVPDIELVLRSTVLGGTPEYYEAQRRWHPSGLKTQIEHVNYNFRQEGEHRFAYDFETLSRLLEHTGFVSVKRRDFDQNLDSADRRVGSLYVEAIRP